MINDARWLVVLSTWVLGVMAAGCSAPTGGGPCGPGEMVRTAERTACVYEAALVAEGDFRCPDLAPSGVPLGDLHACTTRVPDEEERDALCRLLGARCGAQPGDPRTPTTGARCALRNDVVLDTREFLLETGHDECIDAMGMSAGCIGSGVWEQPFCTCRCDVPEGIDAPTCACGEGMVCREDLFTTFGDQDPIAGGYCVPAT